jgi:hypothetical protein
VSGGHDEAPKWERLWPKFRELMEARFTAGHIQYGDRVFLRPPPKTIAEIEQELLDVVGWGFILWCRLRRLDSGCELAGEVQRLREENQDLRRRLYPVDQEASFP